MLRQTLTKSGLQLDDEWFPERDEPPFGIHDMLCTLRDRKHAHSDNAGGRTAELIIEVAEGEIDEADALVPVAWKETWEPFDRDVIPAVVDHCETLAHLLRIYQRRSNSSCRASGKTTWSPNPAGDSRGHAGFGREHVLGS